MKKKKLLFLMGLMSLAVLAGCSNTANDDGSRSHQERDADDNDRDDEDSADDRDGDERDDDGDDESGSQYVLIDDGSDEVVDEDGPITFVKQGYSFVIPEEYGIGFTDDDELPFMASDDFQLLPVVIGEDEDTFNSYYDNASVLTEKAEASGATVISEARVENVNGMDIFCFRVDYGNGEINEVMRARLSETESLGGNMVLLSDMDEEECLNIFAKLVASAEESDEEDTTYNRYITAHVDFTPGLAVSQVTMDAGSVTVTYNVTEGFYYDEEGTIRDDEYSYYDTFSTAEYQHLFVKVMKDEENASGYILQHGEGSSSIDVDGHTFYYTEEEGNLDGIYYKDLLAATDLGNGWLYIIDYSDINEYDIEDIHEFFEIR